MIGCYTEPYLPASFKGVSFVATEADSEHGRRGAEGEFPFGERTAYADLGRKIRRYTLRGRFQDNNHVLQAAAFIAVCEGVGPGILVHPTRGVILSAACVSLKISDKVETEQGVTYVDAQFVEASNWPNGLSLVGTLLGILISPLIEAARTSFRVNYKPNIVQTFRREAVVNALQGQVGFIRQKYENITTDVSNSEARDRVVADLLFVETSDDQAAVTDTADRSIALGLHAVSLANTTGAEKFEVFRDLANTAAKSSSFREPARTSEEAIYATVRIISAAYMAQAALESESTITAADFERGDILASILEDEIGYARSTCQNELFLALTKLRDEAAAKIADKAYNSPALLTYDFRSGVHPLNAAYSIYGDAKRHRSIETRNRVDDSGRLDRFVTASGEG